MPNDVVPLGKTGSLPKLPNVEFNLIVPDAENQSLAGEVVKLLVAKFIWLGARKLVGRGSIARTQASSSISRCVGGKGKALHGNYQCERRFIH
jgi:hypothetical protein